ncbi:mucin-5AC-like protein [Rhynchospora pubera]|uniref:Mucin-5AC-like protein n=1 Tax=Rhynchospora pubera TaxID=906938 RepID=A0AAV8DLH5_9POAL|nr:mucin-5AC-like protein [Rhynchospora pubera]
MDDLFNVDIGKHDYDWLLTPPGTPRELKSEVIEKKPVTIVSTAPKRAPTRSSSTSRASRLSSTTQHPDNGHSNTTTTRPVRSSSVTRSSVQLSSSNNRSTTALNTSTMSLSSRPSTPTKRVPSLTSPRPSAPITTTRTVPSRSTTPVRSRSSAPVSKPTPSSRSSTPTRPRTSTSVSSTSTAPPSTRSVSRSSTPTRTVSSSSAIGRSPSVGRTSSSSTVGSIRRVPSASGLSSAPTSRPSSPGQRPRIPVQPLDIPDFPNETPPNLRTKLPDRPTSAGRVRPGMALSLRSSGPSDHEPVAAAPAPKKVSVPVVSRSKFSDVPSKVSSMVSNGHQAKPSPVQKPAGSGSDSGGFGRNISKKSLDMAIRHMDIRQNLGGIRGASVFPHSIRSNATKGRPARMSDPTANSRASDLHSENGSCNGTNSDNSKSTANNSPDRNIMLLKETLNELDLYGSSRYDAMLLREDVKSTNWLHAIDDKSDQSPVFDHRFEPLPEPFGPL